MRNRILILNILVILFLLFSYNLFCQTDVADIAAARLQADGTNIKITGRVKVNGYGFINYSDFFIQDSSGTDGQTGIFVYYGSRVTCADGDTISDLIGQITTYSNQRELSVQPTQVQTPTNHTTTDPLPEIVPLEITGTDFISNYANIEGEIVAIHGTFDAGDVGNTFTQLTNYNFTTLDAQVIVVRMIRNCALIGQTIPSGEQTVIGGAVLYGTTYEIYPRYLTDLEPYSPAKSKSWSLYE